MSENNESTFKKAFGCTTGLGCGCFTTIIIGIVVLLIIYFLGNG